MYSGTNEIIDTLSDLKYAKKLIEQNTYEVWKSLWENNPTCRQTKIFFNEPSKKKDLKLIMELNRTDMNIFVQLCTGHCSLQRHLNVMGLSEEVSCRICSEDYEETPEHLIKECPALENQRREDPDNIIKHIIGFARNTMVKQALRGETYYEL